MIPRNFMEISFGREIALTRDMGKGLEASLKKVRQIDLQIAKALNHHGLVSYLQRIPYLGRIAHPVEKIVTHVRSIRPLPALESELRESLNGSLVSLLKVGRKAQEEKERIDDLGEIYETAIQEKWGPEQFIRFIEANSNIDYLVSVDGKEMDMKELFAQADSRLSPERSAEKKQEYQDWFKKHIDLSGQYLDSMHALCFVGCELIGGMTRSYFDLTQFRGSMEEIERTLNNLGRGGTASIVSQQAIRQYGTAYVNGMRGLIDEYHRMCDLKDKGSTEFRTSLDKLKQDLNTPRGKMIEKDKGSNQRLISNPN